MSKQQAYLITNPAKSLTRAHGDKGDADSSKNQKCLGN